MKKKKSECINILFVSNKTKKCQSAQQRKNTCVYIYLLAHAHTIVRQRQESDLITKKTRYTYAIDNMCQPKSPDLAGYTETDLLRPRPNSAFRDFTPDHLPRIEWIPSGNTALYVGYHNLPALQIRLPIPTITQAHLYAGLKQGSPEWHNIRRFHIGASEFANVIGLDQYTAQRSFMDNKAGRIDTSDRYTDNQGGLAMKLGNFWEAEVANAVSQWCLSKTGRCPQLTEIGTMIDPIYPVFTSSLDRAGYFPSLTNVPKMDIWPSDHQDPFGDEPLDGNDCIVNLECKTKLRSSDKDPKTAPPHYIAQVQQQMRIANLQPQYFHGMESMSRKPVIFTLLATLRIPYTNLNEQEMYAEIDTNTPMTLRLHQIQPNRTFWDAYAWPRVAEWFSAYEAGEGWFESKLTKPDRSIMNKVLKATHIGDFPVQCSPYRRITRNMLLYGADEDDGCSGV